MLRNAVTTCDGYLNILDEVKTDSEDEQEDIKLSNYEIFYIRMKCLYLLALYASLLKKKERRNVSEKVSALRCQEKE